MIREAVSIEVDNDYLDYLAKTTNGGGKRGEVVMVLRRPGAKVLAMTKYFYPDEVYRLPTGTIRPMESPDKAFEREVWEETGLRLDSWDKAAVIVHHCYCGDRSVDVTSHIIAAPETSDMPAPLDSHERISGYREVDADDLLYIADHLRSLLGRWEGFGKFRAVAHEVVADYLRHGIKL